jgi:hypothetical protein
LEPVRLLNLPGEQFVQASDVLVLLNLPGRHNLHASYLFGVFACGFAIAVTFVLAFGAALAFPGVQRTHLG